MRSLLFILIVLSLSSFVVAGNNATADAGKEASNKEEKKQSGKGGIAPEIRKKMQEGNAKVAKQLPDPGLKVGTKAPDFTLTNYDGKKLNLSTMLKDGPVIISFYRGSWCPYCNLQIRDLIKHNAEFKKYNAQVVAITPQVPDQSLKQVKEQGVSFKVLSDLDNKVMKDYNVFFELPDELVEAYLSFGLNVEEYNGKKRNVLPVPASFIVDQKGIIRAAFADLDYTKRMEPTAIIEALKNI